MIFKALYLLILCPIFVGSVHNFGNRCISGLMSNLIKKILKTLLCTLREYVINNWDKDQFCGRFTVFFISITDSSFWHRASNYVFMFFFKSSLWKRPNTTAFIASAFIFFCLSIFFFPWVEGGFSYLSFLTFFCLATSLSLHASKLNWPFFVFFFVLRERKCLFFLCWNLILNLFFCSKNGYLDFLPF